MEPEMVMIPPPPEDFQTVVPWSDAPESPNARYTLCRYSKLVINPNSLVWYKYSADTAKVIKKPEAYDTFYRLFESDKPAACSAINNDTYPRECLTYYMNENPYFLEPRKDEDPLLEQRNDGFYTQFAYTEGTGVWVLEGSREAYGRLLVGWEKNSDWGDQLQRAGARYYDHWNDHPLAKRYIERELASEDPSRREPWEARLSRKQNE